MKYSYSSFLRDNRNTSREDGCATILNVNFAMDKCIVMNPSRQRFSVPIPILICEMLNDMCHINNASRLKNWPNWDKDYKFDYPKDYFQNKSKYIIELQD